MPTPPSASLQNAANLLETARQLAPRLRAASAEIESERRLPEDLFQALAQAGVFKAHLPPQLGGRGATLSQLAPVIEELARADGSAGWLAYVGTEANCQLLHLDPATARHVAASEYLFVAGMFTPGGSRAVACPGGYRLSGRWHTCSGSVHCNWVIAGATVYERDEDDEPRRGPTGAPLVRLNFVPRQAVEVLDTWYVGGLRGTNSNDIQIHDAFVSEAFGAYDVPPPDIGLHLMVPLGIARAAMDEFVDLASRAGPSKAHGLLHRDLPAVWREIAAAEASLRAARAYAFEAIAAAERTETTPTVRDEYLLAAYHVTQSSVDVVDRLHRLAGTAGIYQSSRLLRCLLDVHTAAAHVSLQPFNLENAGRILLRRPE